MILKNARIRLRTDFLSLTIGCTSLLVETLGSSAEIDPFRCFFFDFFRIGMEGVSFEGTIGDETGSRKSDHFDENNSRKIDTDDLCKC